MSDSIDDSIRRALAAHEEGASMDAAPTIATQPPKGASGGHLGVLPGHAVERLIARGGMGAVYLARQEALEREVAVKVMTSGAESPEMAARFRREALVLGKLAHPNIVPVYDVGTDEDGGLFYTMKLVKGRTLQAILNDLRREDADALNEHTLASLLTVFRKVCDAMAFAHSQGIIHRDLKPENVMVGEFGEVLVMDWGLAKTIRRSDKETIRGGGGGDGEALSLSDGLMDSLSQQTLQGSVMGTPQYMSPEQARGEIDELDERSDLFSLGGILYAILTLRAPVEGKTLQEVLEKVKSGEITSPTELGGSSASRGQKVEKGKVLEAERIKPLPHLERGRVPLALSAVAMKALALAKEDRYAAVEQLSSDIERYQSGFATEAERAGLAKQVGLLIRRNKALFGMAAAALVVLSISGAWFVMNLQVKERRAMAGEKAALEAEAVALSKGEETRKALAKASLALAETQLQAANGPMMRTYLNQVPEDLRDGTWEYLMGETNTSFWGRRGVGPGVAANPVQPGVFGFVDFRGIVNVVNVRTGETLLRFQAKGDSPDAERLGRFAIAFSPDGSQIAVVRSGKDAYIAVFDSETGARLALLTEGDRIDAPRHPLVRYSPDGQRLLFTDPASGVGELWDIETGERLWQHELGLAQGAFLGRSGRVALFGFEQGIFVVDEESGEMVRVLSEQKTFALEASPDGSKLLIALTAHMEKQGVGQCLDAETGQVICQFRTAAETFSCVEFAPDGQRFVTGATLLDGRQEITVRDAGTGRILRSLLGGEEIVYDVAIHPVSSELVVASVESRAWDLTGVTTRWVSPRMFKASITFLGHQGEFMAPLVEPTAIAFRLAGMQVEPTLQVEGMPVLGVASVSRDGRRILARPDLFSLQQTNWILERRGDQVVEARQFETLSGAISLHVSPDGHLGAVVGGRADGKNSAEVFDLESGQGLCLLEKPPPDQLLSSRFRQVAWLDSGRLVGSMEGRRPSDRLLEESLIVWDGRSGKMLRRVLLPDAAHALALSPDGKWLAESGVAKTVRVRDAETLEMEREFRAHNRPVTALAWHPKDALLATGSEDLMIRLWDMERDEKVEEIQGMLGAPTLLEFDPAGKLLGCAAMDGRVRIWEPRILRQGSGVEDLKAAETRAEAEFLAALSRIESQGKAHDLLVGLTAEEVEQSGDGWTLREGKLFSPPRRHGAVLPVGPSLENCDYAVTLKIRELAVREVLHIVLPVGDRLTGFDLDGYQGIGAEGARVTSGLIQVSDDDPRRLAAKVDGKQVKGTTVHELKILVEREGDAVQIRVALNGRPIVSWGGPLENLTQHEFWRATAPGRLVIGTLADNWEVSGIELIQGRAGE